MVGQIGILRENIEGKDVWGIGYILNSDARGCGYATEGAKAMAEYAFETMGVEKLICDIRPMNTESIAVAKRIGMKETGSLSRSIMERKCRIWFLNLTEKIDNKYYSLKKPADAGFFRYKIDLKISPSIARISSRGITV